MGGEKLEWREINEDWSDMVRVGRVELQGGGVGAEVKMVKAT